MTTVRDDIALKRFNHAEATAVRSNPKDASYSIGSTTQRCTVEEAIACLYERRQWTTVREPIEVFDGLDPCLWGRYHRAGRRRVAIVKIYRQRKHDSA